MPFKRSAKPKGPVKSLRRKRNPAEAKLSPLQAVLRGIYVCIHKDDGWIRRLAATFKEDSSLLIGTATSPLPATAQELAMNAEASDADDDLAPALRAMGARFERDRRRAILSLPWEDDFREIVAASEAGGNSQLSPAGFHRFTLAARWPEPADKHPLLVWYERGLEQVFDPSSEVSKRLRPHSILEGDPAKNRQSNWQLDQAAIARVRQAWTKARQGQPRTTPWLAAVHARPRVADSLNLPDLLDSIRQHLTQLATSDRAVSSLRLFACDACRGLYALPGRISRSRGRWEVKPGTKEEIRVPDKQHCGPDCRALAYDRERSRRRLGRR